MTIRLSRRNAVLPEIFSVDDHHLDGIDVEVVEEARVHADLRIVEVGFPGRPVRRLGEGAAAADGAEMMLDRVFEPQR